MNVTSDDSDDKSVLAQIDAVANRFEAMWREGQAPSLESLLTQIEPAYREQLLRELQAVRRQLEMEATDKQLPSCSVKFKENSPAEKTLGNLPTDAEADLGTHSQDDCRNIRSTVGSFDLKFSKPLATGELLAGRYLIGDFIAQGGMGVVHRATDSVFGREVAVKRLLPKYERSANARERFRREAELTARLQHPGIPPMHDLGSLPHGDPFLAMKLIAGRTLADLLNERKSPTEDLPRFLSIFEQIARAVGYAHAQGVIHRDLKPANVMVGAFGEVQVMDWGLAKGIGTPEAMRSSPDDISDDPYDRTMDGAIMGTPTYMAPEQARGEVSTLDARTDVFALGVILLEILTGRGLYDGQKKLEILEQAQQGNVSASLDRIQNSGIDADLVAVVTQCLAFESSARPNDGEIVADQIANHRVAVERRLRESETIRAAAEATSKEQVKRRRTATIATAVIAAVFATGAGVSAMFALRATSEATKAVKEKKESEQQLYFAQVAREDGRVNAGALDQARAGLRAIAFERRGVEHGFLSRLVVGTPFTFRAHDHWVTSVAFSADGTWLASCEGDFPRIPGTIKLWDAMTGAQLATLRGHEDNVFSVVFSPDGARIASASSDKTIKVWDARTRAELVTLRGHEDNVNSVAFSPDGTRLASASSDKTIRIWDARTWAELVTLREHESKVSFVVFSPDGTRLASCNGDAPKAPGIVKLWNAQTGAELAELRGHKKWVTSVAFSPNCTRLASASYDGTVKLWNSRTGAELTTLQGHEDNVNSVAFSPDGTRLASASYDKTIKLWDARTGAELGTLRGHEHSVNSVAFSPDGTRLASGSFDKTISLWDAPTRAEFDTLRGHKSWVCSAAFSPDGNRLASASDDKTVKLWDSRTGAELNTLRGHESRVQSVAFSSDGNRLASASYDKSIKLWDAMTGDELITLRGHESYINSVAFSPDGNRLASASEDHTVKVWDARKGAELVTLRGHEDNVDSVAFSPDGTRLASCSTDKTIKLWDSRTGAELNTLRGHESRVQSVAFSSDGNRLASASYDKSIKLWDAMTGDELITLRGHESYINSVAFSPDGARLVSGSWDKTVKLWDARTGAELVTLRGHEDNVNSVAFSPDGTRLASASSDKTIRIWDSRAGAEVVTLRGHEDSVQSVAITSDGKRLVSRDASNGKIVWDTTTARQLNEKTTALVATTNVSSDGRYRAIPLGREILLERRTKYWDALWSESHDRRERWKRLWYYQDAAKAESAKDWFAVVWNLEHLVELTSDFKPKLKRLAGDRAKTTKEFQAYIAGLLTDAREQLALSRAELPEESFPKPATVATVDTASANIDSVFSQPAASVSPLAYERIRLLLFRKQPADALALADRFAKWAENDPLDPKANRYNGACFFALCASGETGDSATLHKALALLRKLQEDGYFDETKIAYFRQDRDFAGVRGLEAFKEFDRSLGVPVATASPSNEKAP